VVEHISQINCNALALLFRLILQKVLENFPHMKKSDFIEWQEDRPQSALADLISASA